MVAKNKNKMKAKEILRIFFTEMIKNINYCMLRAYHKMLTTNLFSVFLLVWAKKWLLRLVVAGLVVSAGWSCDVFFFVGCVDCGFGWVWLGLVGLGLLLVLLVLVL